MTDYKKELFNYKKLSYIIQKWDELGLPEECKRDWSVHNHLTGKTFYVNPLMSMREYLSGAVKTKKYGYVRNVSYHQSKSSKESGYILGRRYVKDGKGLQSFNHIIRNTISGEFYDDIDIVNAHSSLLSQLCKKKGWCCKYVDYYNDNREECLKSMMDTDATKTRKDCKTTVIVAMYNNGEVSGFYGLKWFDEFKANIQIIQDEMAKDPEFKAEYNFAVEKNKNKAPEKQNVLGSMCSLIMNRYENEILKKAEEYLKIYKGFETTNMVYAFDGFQFNKGKITNEIMRELESYIEKETGWKIDYIIKPMDEVIELPDLNDIEINEEPVSLENVMELTHYDVALFIRDYTKGKFVSDGESFYYFDEDKHRWDINGNPVLRNYLSDVISPIYYNKYLELKKNGCENVAYLNDIIATSLKLKTSGFKDSVMKELKSILFDADFVNELDENRYLIGFNNGVYDLEKNCFRDGRPEDKISKSVGYNYTASVNAEKLKKLEDFFDSILPNAGLVKYLKNRMAYNLCGAKILQNSNLMFLIGVGSNGKSVLKSLIEMVMGDYCDTVHMNVLTSKRHSSTASPELVKLKGVRTVMCEEPDDTEPVSTADIKVWTGEGQIVGRGLFSKVIVSFKPQFSMMVLMNNIVDLKSKDEGFARRLDNVEFPYRFVNEPKMPNEKQIVIGMAEAFLKDIEYRQALMFMLLDVWKTDNPIVNGIVKPAEVVAFTKDYLLEQDVVRMFINEKIDFVEVEKQDDTEWIHGSNFITYQSLENAFKSSHYYDHNSKKPKNWFNNQMRNLNLVSVKKTWKKGGHHNSMMYIGLAYKNVENDDDI